MGQAPQISTLISLPAAKHVFVYRRQFHGKDHLRSANHYHVFDMGFGWAERVREHAALGLQRRSRYPLHVRSIKKINIELGERMVSTGKGVQQGR